MLPEDKFSVIRNYLRTEFPGFDLDDRYDSDRIAQTFRLVKEQKIHLVTVSREFIDDHRPSEISAILKHSHLKDSFLDEKVSRLIVTNEGIQTETL